MPRYPNTGFFENVSSVVSGKLTPNELNPVLGYLDNDGDVWAGEYDEPGLNDLKTHGLTGTLNWDFGKFRLTSITDGSHVERDYIEDTDASMIGALVIEGVVRFITGYTALATGIGFNDACIGRKTFATDQTLGDAMANNIFKHKAEGFTIAKTAMTVLGER